MNYYPLMQLCIAAINSHLEILLRYSIMMIIIREINEGDSTTSSDDSELNSFVYAIRKKCLFFLSKTQTQLIS